MARQAHSSLSHSPSIITKYFTIAIHPEALQYSFICWDGNDAEMGKSKKQQLELARREKALKKLLEGEMQ